MTYISPLLRNHIAQPDNKTQLDNRHEKIYQDLQKRANEVKPNEAKAKMVSQNPIIRAIDTVVDTGKDCANFTKAVKTGKMSDNNLGRINDLGMKAGALLIATYLASQAKTKTDKIMQFVGGGTFLASMTLWPKLFINLPARLIHGFNIDQKYINAQGDKKDFFLDNQFIPWDAYSKEELEKIGKRTGIDYNSENGEEKIKRKMQKTALQNRTLWMATAGFATPLMTAMIGNAVTPKIKDAVVEKGFQKAKDTIEDEKKLTQYLSTAKPDVRNADEINNILKTFDGTSDSFKNLGAHLQITAGLAEDEARTLGDFGSNSLESSLKQLYEQQSDLKLPEGKTIEETIKETLGKTQKAVQTKDNQELMGFVAGKARKTSKEATEKLESLAQEIADTIKEKGNITIEDLRKATDGKVGNFDEFLEKLKAQGITIDSSKFKKTVTEFNQGTLANVRGRIKSYTELINSITGSTAESKSTKEYTTIIENYVNALGFDFKGLKSAKDGDTLQLQETLANFFKAKASQSEESYNSFLKTFFTTEDESFTKALQKAASGKNIQTVTNAEDNTGLLRSILGGDSHLGSRFKTFIESKTADLDAIRLRGIWCAELERMIKDKKLQGDEAIAAARSLLYRGTISSINNSLEATHDAKKVVETVLFDTKNYSETALKTAGFKNYIAKMAQIVKGESDLSNTVKNNLCPNFAEAMKKRMTSLFNDKTWMKRFGIMSGILVGITLLAQPFFGNIKKEFSDKKQGGAN